jgi:hypothetical protein
VDGFNKLPMLLDAVSVYSTKDGLKYTRDQASEVDHLINYFLTKEKAVASQGAGEEVQKQHGACT